MMTPMMLKVIAMAAALGTAAAEGGADTCSVSVDFGSFCCGIDNEAYAAMKDFAQSSPLVASQSERAYGMEGEKVLCLNARSEADATALRSQVKGLIAGRKTKAPVKVR